MTSPLAPNGGDKTKRFVPGKPTDPELVRLLELVKTLPPMTPIEHAIQRRSWVRGEMGMADPQQSPEETDALLANIPEFALLDRIEALERDLAEKREHADNLIASNLDIHARATSAELTVTALRERLEGIAKIAGHPHSKMLGLYESALDQIHTLAKGPGQ